MEIKYYVSIHAGHTLSNFSAWSDGTYTQSVTICEEDGDVKIREKYTYTSKEEWKQALREAAELSVLLV